MPTEIRLLADALLRDPHVVELAQSGPAATIEHILVAIHEDRKRDLLERILTAESCESAIVFMRTKHRAHRLAQQLDRAGHRAVGLQGNMSQSQRDCAMQGFQKRRFDVLVAPAVVKADRAGPQPLWDPGTRLPLGRQEAGVLDDANALRTRALGALALIERDALSLAQVVETTALAGRHVKEDVGTIARLDETKASVGKSLDRTFSHP